MRYKMQSLDSYSGIVGLINYQFYNTTHYVQMSRISQGHRPRSQLQALRAYAAYSTDLEMTWLS